MFPNLVTRTEVTQVLNYVLRMSVSRIRYTVCDEIHDPHTITWFVFLYRWYSFKEGRSHTLSHTHTKGRPLYLHKIHNHEVSFYLSLKPYSFRHLYPYFKIKIFLCKLRLTIPGIFSVFLSWYVDPFSHRLREDSLYPSEVSPSSFLDYS